MTTDATQVTGSAAAGEGSPRPGAVLAERYELLEVLDDQGLSVGYRALDQETERPVLVRVLSGEALPAEVCGPVVDRLRSLQGVGGRFLSSLLDVDAEQGQPFTVEAWPAGTSLASILEARRSRTEPLGPREVLPVVARLGAALDALPRHWNHGDVRAERIWLDTDGLKLTGAYLLVALPPEELARRMSAVGPAALLHAPELRRGQTSSSADRWGVAAIAWEALTAQPPDAGTEPGLPAPLRSALSALLAEEPRERPRDLSRLLSALAEHASLPVPQLDPEPLAPPKAAILPPPTGAPTATATRAAGKPAPGGAEDGTVEVPFEQIHAPRKIPGAAPDGTQEISFDQILPDEDDSLDPRLVRAALDLQEAPASDDTAKHGAVGSGSAASPPEDAGPATARTGREHSVDGLDPRLVRAALGVTLDSDESGDVQELPSDDLELLEGSEPSRALQAPTSPAQPEGPSRPGPPRSGRERGETEAGSAASGPAAGSDAEVPSRPPGAGQKPAGVAPRPPPRPRPARPVPAPRPARPAADAPSPAAPSASAPDELEGGTPALAQPPPTAAAVEVATEESPRRPQHGPSPAASSSHATPTEGTPRRHAEPSATPATGSRVAGPRSRKRISHPGTAQQQSRTGVFIVVGALILALAIVGMGFLIAAHRRSEAARDRQIEQRLEQLRGGRGGALNAEPSAAER